MTHNRTDDLQRTLCTTETITSHNYGSHAVAVYNDGLNRSSRVARSNRHQLLMFINCNCFSFDLEREPTDGNWHTNDLVTCRWNPVRSPAAWIIVRLYAHLSLPAAVYAGQYVSIDQRQNRDLSPTGTSGVQQPINRPSDRNGKGRLQSCHRAAPGERNPCSRSSTWAIAGANIRRQSGRKI